MIAFSPVVNENHETMQRFFCLRFFFQRTKKENDVKRCSVSVRFCFLCKFGIPRAIREINCLCLIDLWVVFKVQTGGVTKQLERRISGRSAHFANLHNSTWLRRTRKTAKVTTTLVHKHTKKKNKKQEGKKRKLQKPTKCAKMWHNWTGFMHPWRMFAWLRGRQRLKADCKDQIKIRETSLLAQCLSNKTNIWNSLNHCTAKLITKAIPNHSDSQCTMAEFDFYTSASSFYGQKVRFSFFYFFEQLKRQNKGLDAEISSAHLNRPNWLCMWKESSTNCMR